jgi:MoaA/NifB/PqqE/SkfB family radical SAM enzyme
MDKTCCLPWNHLATHPNGTVTLCCQADMDNAAGFAKTSGGALLNLNKHSVIEIVNSYSFKQARLEMLDDKEPFACRRCYESERNGGWSKRLYENKNFNWGGKEEGYTRVDDLGYIHPEFEFIELRLGNVCNLKCMTCNSISSAKWIADEKILGEKIQWFKPQTETKQSKWFSSEEFYDVLAAHGPSLKKIYINGGEPLLVKEHKVLLQALVDRGFAANIDLQYNTNLTITDLEVVELWSKFRTVYLMASIDDVGTRNEILRFPSKWNDTWENLYWYWRHKPANTHMVVCQTISALNAEYMYDMMAWLKVLGIGHVANYVHWPSYFSAKAIPPKYREVIRSLNKDMTDQEIASLESWLSMPFEQAEYDKMIEFVTELDQIRGTNSFEHFGILSSALAF